jgi:ABC-2 type transport system ATP-binding protein
VRTSLVALDTPAALRARLFGRRVRITLAGDAGPYVATVRNCGVTMVTADHAALVVEPGQVPTPDIVAGLVAAGAAIESVVPEEPPLEEVYLRLLHSGEAQA